MERRPVVVVIRMRRTVATARITAAERAGRSNLSPGLRARRCHVSCQLSHATDYTRACDGGEKQKARITHSAAVAAVAFLRRFQLFLRVSRPLPPIPPSVFVLGGPSRSSSFSPAASASSPPHIPYLESLRAFYIRPRRGEATALRVRVSKLHRTHGRREILHDAYCIRPANNLHILRERQRKIETEAGAEKIEHTVVS